MGFDLPPEEAAAVRALALRVAGVGGVTAVVLGGSRAAGTHHAGSDVDLGIYYRDESALDLVALRALAADVDDGPNPVVTDPWAWGRWVNGGAWLRVEGRRVDWIYRRISHVEEVLTSLRVGDVEFDWIQQPPFGFASTTYGAETAACLPLHDDAGAVAGLKQLVAEYPEPLRKSIAQNWTWAADFALRKGSDFAAKGDVANTVGCVSRAMWFLPQVLHALEHRWCFPDSGAIASASALAGAPDSFAARIDTLLGAPGTDVEALERTTRKARGLLDEVAAAAGELYRAPPFPAA